MAEPSFKDLCVGLSGGSVGPPGKRQFMTMLEKEYHEMKSKLIGRLNKVEFKCTTTDVWSHRGRSFSGFTVHYYNEKLDRESYALAFRPMHGKHTYDNLGRTVHSVHEEFELKPDDITHTLTDGAVSYTKMFKSFGRDSTVERVSQIEINDDDEDDLEQGDIQQNFVDDVDNEQIDLDDVIMNTIDLSKCETSEIDIVLPEQMRCFSHLLNLVPKDFEKSINNSAVGNIYDNALRKLQRVWYYSRKSNKAKLIIDQVCGCMLPISVVTRWNSLYRAINKIVELKTKV